jgi:LuxR family maltose regulon positive regulatory protein
MQDTGIRDLLRLCLVPPSLSTVNVPAPDLALQRPRLLRILDESLVLNASLTLVCGPAGYGKTTIISDWLRTVTTIAPHRTAWLTLERSDDKLSRFLTYLIASLQHIQPGIGNSVLKLLQTHRPSPIQILATLLVNDLSEIPGGFLLVLDDFHLTSSEPTHNFITFLIDHQPPQISLF